MHVCEARPQRPRRGRKESAPERPKERALREMADTLKARKVRNIEKTKPDLVAAGNIGCIQQIASGTDIPITHTVELLDWVTGGPMPLALDGKLPARQLL